VKFVVGVGDMKISANGADEIITFALGSCLGITVHDPVACVGGMIHAMLPLSSIAREKAEENPYMFVDTGVPLLFGESYKAGAVKGRLVVKVAGGACANGGGQDHFQIGRRNLDILLKLFAKNGIAVAAQDIAGNKARTLSLEIGTGLVRVSSQGVVTNL
jgi:chemotaxis protein CheD